MSSSLVDRVRRGHLNFELFVEILSDRGYITEQTQDEGCRFESWHIEKSTQEDFDELFTLFFPGHLNDVKIESMSTDEGGTSGSYSYGLFNRSVISPEEMHRILVGINHKHQRTI